MNFHIITLFPESFDSYINSSILGRAIEDKKIKIKFYNPRDFSDNKFRHIDQKPYSGGPGMVIQALPVVKAVEKALRQIKSSQKKDRGCKIIFFSPGGKQFDTDYAKKTAQKYTDIILISGRYEGIDARVKSMIKQIPLSASLSQKGKSKKSKVTLDEISIGPYVLTGGELPAMAIIDCVSRQVQGVLGNFDSLEESRLASSDVYTRPEVLEYRGKKYRVPKVLLSGNHQKIEEWRKSKKK